MIDKNRILEELKKIIDPELHINIVDLGLIYHIDVSQETGVVVIRMTLTTPGCPLSFVFREWVPAAAKKVEGVKDVKIDLVWEPPWDPDKLSDDAKEELGMIR
jgi:metal-sulfur cluster biosynthetic enzyme